MFTKILKYIFAFMAVAVQAKCQFTYTKSFFGSGTPVGRYVGNSGLKYVNLNDMTLWNQQTIPKGTSWSNIGSNAVLTTDYLPEGLVNKYNSTQTAVDTIYRTAGKDSIQFKIQGRYHAIKDSAGISSGGTVTSVSSGNLSPLFTVGVATATTTPAFTFTLSNAAAYTVFARAAGVGVPSYQAIDTTWIANFYLKVRGLFTGNSGITYSNGIISGDTTTTLATYYRLYKSIDSLALTIPAVTVPAGATTEIQYNNAGAFGADNGFTRTAAKVTVAGDGTGTLGSLYVTRGDAVNQYLLLHENVSSPNSAYVTFKGSGGNAVAMGATFAAGAPTSYIFTDPSGVPLNTINTTTGENTIANLSGVGTRMVTATATGVLGAAAIPTGTVTSVGFTGGLISVANPTTTPAFTVAGTSGGIPYFSSASTWASSGALTASALVIGGGAGSSPTSLALGTANQILGMNSGATANEYKTLAVGTTGTDFAIAHAANSVTFNLPDASASARGAITTGTQTIGGTKTATSQFINQRNSLAATTGAGLTNYNATAATGGAPVQVSPRYASIGAAWSGAASQLVDFGFYTVPVNGTSPVTGYLQFDYAVNSGAKSNIGRFTSTGTFQPVHLGGISTAPTIAAGTGAGTAPTVSVSNATDISMLVNVTTGTLPVAAGTVVTITFNVPYATAPNWSLSPGNAATALLGGVTNAFITTTTTTAVMTAGATALVASTAYVWSLLLIQ